MEASGRCRVKTAGEECPFFAAVFLHELGEAWKVCERGCSLRGVLQARRFFFEAALSGAGRARATFLRPHPKSRVQGPRSSRAPGHIHPADWMGLQPIQSEVMLLA